MSEKFFLINKLKSINLPDKWEDLMAFYAMPEVQKAANKAQEHYLPWDEFRKKAWVPAPKETVWALVGMQRKLNAEKTLIQDKDGEYYTFNPRTHVQFLHQIDLELGGNFMGMGDFSEGDRRQIIRRNLVEESIASSKLEGANTSRAVARKMLTEGRKPRNKDEQMIVNNHAVMTRIEEEYKQEKLSVDLIKDLHRQVTQGTLQNSSHEGALRQTFDKEGNRLKIMPWDEETVTYITPDREFVDKHLPRLVAFANDEGKGEFIHPLIKAIMLHFWVGLLHPFEDGNGRLARILFYWYMLRKGYWAFSYLSLSERLLKSPRQYAEAYIYTEQDGYDLNYFIFYNIQKLKLARQQFEIYLRERISEHRQEARIIQSGYNINSRQIRLLQQLAKGEQSYITPAEYRNINADIGPVTVANDLRKLLEMGFLKKAKRGRNVFYFPTEKADTIIK